MTVEAQSPNRPSVAAGPPAVSALRPQLKIVGLRARNLGPILQLDLPEDGTAWDGFPDLVVVAGINGSGKTTLLEAIHAVCDGCNPPALEAPPWPVLKKCGDLQLDLDYRDKSGHTERLQWAWGAASDGLGRQDFRRRGNFFAAVPPAVVYIPMGERRVSDEREKGVIVPPPNTDDQFVFRWSPPERWADSLEGVLYGARWADLNAKESGQPEKATHFAYFREAFERFFAGQKTLKWSLRGELYVEIAGGKQRHGLSELSSGEKQMIVVVAELLRLWRPGSLILIDEPELHLHDAWQVELWTLLHRLLSERGGQVILATQSSDLFSLADHKSVVVLGAWRR